MSKRGIIIANTGSPDNPSPEAVSAYLERFLSHPRIVPMDPKKWDNILHKRILPKRSVESAEKYAAIWTDEGFTFIRDHDTLARKLAAALKARGETAAVAFAMSFGNPSIPLACKLLRDAGCDTLDVLPLYPQNAFSQAYVVADETRAALEALGWDVPCRIIGDYSRNEKYLEAVADTIRASDFDPARGDRIIFGFHSIPRNDVEAGDTYDTTTRITCERLVEMLNIPELQWIRGFQSRFDKDRKWLSPFVPEIMKAMAKQGFDGRLFYVCPNFAVDNLETHYDVEMTMRFQWYDCLVDNSLELREDSFNYIPCLGTSDAHVEVILDVLDRAAKLI